jgi:hypothetical protein
MSRVTTIETVERLRSQQTIWPEWMKQATEGMADDAPVQVVRNVTGFGIFVESIEAVAR